jgi:hypothetical protein
MKSAGPATGDTRGSTQQRPLVPNGEVEAGNVIGASRFREGVSESAAEPRNWQARLVHRLGLEVLALAVWIARLPIIGAYLFIILAALAAASQTPADPLTRYVVDSIKTETGGRICRWFLPEHSYYGLSGLTSFGEAAAKLLFGFYVLSLPVRLFRPPRTPPSFGRKVRRLGIFLMGVMVVSAWLLRSAKFAPDTSYWGMVGTFAALLTMFSATLLPLLALECWIEKRMDRVQSPEER